MTAPQKYCLHCGAALVRNGTSRPPQRRSFCGNECAIASRVGKTTAKRDNTKPCMCGCGVMLVQRADETPSKWNKRRYATNQCWARHRATPIEQRDHKACECCGVRFMRPHNLTKANWQIRRYCSNACRVRWDVQHGNTVAVRLKAKNERRRQAMGLAPPVVKAPKPPPKTAAEKRSADTERKHIARQKARKDAPAVRLPQVLRSVPSPKPVGKFQSVEEWLAAGGQVTRCPTAILAPIEGGVWIDPADRAALEQHSQRAIAQYGAHVMRAPQSRRG